MDIKDFLIAIRRHWLTFIIVPWLLGSLGFGLGSVRTKQYSATATVLLRLDNPSDILQSPNVGNSKVVDSSAASSYVQTQLGVITGRTVLEAALSTVKDSKFDYDKLKRSIKAVQRGQTTLVDIVATAADPKKARDNANAVVSAYATNRENASVRGLKDALSRVKDQLNTLQTDLGKLATTTEKVSPLAQARLDASTVQFQELFNRQQKLEIDLQLQQGGTEIVSKAELPKEPSSVSPLSLAVTLGFLGLILAGAIAIVRSRLDASIRTAEDVASATSSPVLTVVPESADHNDADALELLTHPFAPFSEAVRGLRTAIQFQSFSDPVKSIVVTSTSPGEGKTTVAANLAAAHAQTGKRVLLVAADLRRPRLDELFGIDPKSEGLSDLVMSLHIAQTRGDSTNVILETDLLRVITGTECQGLDLLPSGTVPPNPNELLGSDAMGVLINHVVSLYDVIVFDSPPVGVVSDAMLVARLADGVLVVVGSGMTDTGHLTRTTHKVESAGLRLVGVVVNRAAASSGEDGAYGVYGRSLAAKRRTPSKARTAQRQGPSIADARRASLHPERNGVHHEVIDNLQTELDNKDSCPVDVAEPHVAETSNSVG